VSISYGFWMRRFGGDPRVAARMIRINDQPLAIIGITPKDLSGLQQGAETDISVPMMPPGMSVSRMQTFGRLKPGVTVGQAQAALDT
jgi:hypothetical protein